MRRSALSLALLLALGGAARADQPAGAPVHEAPAPVAAVLDARPAWAPAADFDATWRALALAPELRMPADADLETALSGRTMSLVAEGEAEAARRRAAERYQALDCGAATAAAEDAIVALLRSAPQEQVAAPVTHMLAIMLLCADQAGDRASAHVATVRLRRLGHEATPPGVPAAVWSRYPEIDATSNERPAAVSIAGSRPAKVWVDLQPAGLSPVTVALTPGRHFLLLEDGDVRVARVLEVTGNARLVEPLPDSDARNPRKPLADRVAGWRRAGVVEPAELEQVMRDTGIVLTVVLLWKDGDQKGSAQIWVLPPAAGSAPVLAATVESAAPEAILAGVRKALPLLAPPPPLVSPGDRQKRKRMTRTWTLVFVGAVVVGAATVFLVSESGDTLQRIEVAWP